MKIHVPFASAALIAALAPSLLSAATVDAPESLLTAFAEFDTQALGSPLTDFDSDIGSSTTLFGVEALVSGFAPAFPGQPNSVGTGFASAAGDSSGSFGVGVNANFGPSARPRPHSMLASGTLTQDLLNDTDEVRTFGARFFIPAPVIVLAGQIGDFFPVGVDPALDVNAEVLARIVTKVTRTDGSFDEQVVFEYGMKTGRNAAGELGVTTTLGAGDPEVVEDIGFFSFVLPEQSLDADTIAVVGPGDSITLDFQYFALGGTGFGETAVFAAIGDPFDLSSGGGRIEFVQDGGGVAPPPPAPIPLPTTLPLLATGLAALAFARRRRS
jgi:hypothetical protein